MKLSIVLMLIAHPVSGKACLGHGSLMRGTNNSFEYSLTGHWTCTEQQCCVLTQLDEWWKQETFQNWSHHHPLDYHVRHLHHQKLFLNIFTYSLVLAKEESQGSERQKKWLEAKCSSTITRAFWFTAPTIKEDCSLLDLVLVLISFSCLTNLQRRQTS